MKACQLIILLFLGQVLCAQVQLLRIDDELLDDPEYVSYVSESEDGFYWLGSVSGLVRFDGKMVKNIKIEDSGSSIRHGTNVSSRMFPDQRGRQWFTTNSAIHYYSPATDSIKTFQVVSEGQPIEDNYYGILFNQRTNRFWLRAGEGIYSFAVTTGISKLLAAPVSGVSFSTYHSSEGNIHVFGSPFATAGFEYLTVTADEEEFQYQPIDYPLEVTQVTPLSATEVLAATNQGLRHLTVTEHSIKTRTISSDLPATRCYSTAPSARKGHFWASFPASGIYEVELASGRINRKLALDHTTDIRSPEYLNTDKQDNLWITDINKGLFVLQNEENGFRTIRSPDNDLVYDMYQDGRHDVWAITKKGSLLKIDYTSKKLSDKTANLGKVQVFKGRFYQLGLTWILNGVHSLHTRKINETNWRGAAAKKSFFPGVIAPRGQQLRLNNFSIRQFKFRPDSIIEFVPSRFEDDSLKFAGLYPLSDSTFITPEYGTGLLRHYYVGKDSSIKQTHVDTLIPTIYAFHKSRKRKIYLGTDNGLFTLEEEGVRKVFDELGPYYSTVVSSIGEDYTGRLWVGSSKGLLCYDPNTNKVLRYGKEDGLPSNQFHTARPILLPDSSMYFGTTEGIVSFRPRKVLANEPPAQAYLDEIWVNRLPIEKDSSLLKLRRLKLPHYRNTVDISVGLTGLKQSGLAGISYQLVGYEESASYTAPGQRIRYNKLPAGEYQFKYSAINRHGIKSSAKKVLVIITPHFTQTITFWLLVTCAIVFSLLLIHLLLLRRERARQTRLREDREKIIAERERIASELHDDLGGDLASMTFLIEGHQYLQQQGVSSDLDVNRISELANGAIKNMREMIWVLDNEQTTLDTLGEQLLTTARQMAAAADLSLQVDIVEELPAFELSSIQKKNILLIAKEAMQNIRKHAEASAFTLRFVVEKVKTHSILILEVSDNGKGIPENSNQKKHNHGHGHGLYNLKKRATAINGILHLIPAIPSGTKVKFTLPLTPPK